MSRTAVFAPPFSRPFARLSLNFRVISSCISPCAQYAAFAGEKLEIWHVPKHPIPSFGAWDKKCEFAPGSTSTACLAWSNDSKRIAVGLSSGIVTVYTQSERMIGVNVKPLTLHGHRAPIICVRFVGKKGLITVSEDGALFCWRLRYNDDEESSGKKYEPKEYEFVKGDESRNPKRRMFIVPVNAKLISRHFIKQGGAKRVRSCDVADPLLVVGLSNGVFALYELPDAMTMEDDALDRGLFEMGELRAKKRAKKLAKDASPAGENENDEDNDKDDEDDDDDDDEETRKRVGFTDLTLLHTLSASGGAITRIAFSHNGAWIAMSSSQSGQIIVWDWRAETHILKQQGHTLSVETVAFSPDGRAIATGSKDGPVKLWGVHTGFCVSTFTNHTAAVSAVTFSANDVIISASYDGTVRAFDIRRYRNFRVMVGPPPRRQFGCVAADGAGDLIAAGCVDSFEIIVWSLRTGQVVEVLNGHRGPVCGLSFRPRRGTLASCSWDRTIRLWDMYERKGNCEVLEHAKEVLDVCYRPDGNEVAGCTTAGEIILWNAEDGNINGTIDGSRDSAPGRLRESRTVADEKGYFQSLKYSADGKFMIAGSVGKHICFYHVGEGSRPVLVKSIEVSENQQFDGLLSELNSRHLTDGGHAVEEIDDLDEHGEDYGKLRMAARRSMPGARDEVELQRKKLVQAQVKCVAVCSTGMLYGAVTGEGVLIYGNGAENDDDDVLFDPTHLDIDVTEEAVKKAVDDGLYVNALVIGLRLNERDLLNYVVEKIDVDDIALVVSEIASVYFSRVIALFAWRLEHTPHLEFNLKWARCLLLEHGRKVKAKGFDVVGVNAVLRSLHRACLLHSKRLTPVADQNEAMLQYLLTISQREPKK